MNPTRLTAAAKLAVAEEIARMTGRPDSDVAKLAAMKSDRLLDEFETVQAYWLAVPMWDAFNQNRPLWKIDPAEAWAADGANTDAVRTAAIKTVTPVTDSPGGRGE